MRSHNMRIIMEPQRIAPSHIDSRIEETYTVFRSLIVKFVCTSCGSPHGVNAYTVENRNRLLQPMGPGVSRSAGSLAATPADMAEGPPIMQNPAIRTAIIPKAIISPCTTSV